MHAAPLTHTVVTQAAVGGARRPEDLAGEAVFQLDRLPVDQHLPGSGWPVSWPTGAVSCIYRIQGRGFLH